MSGRWRREHKVRPTHSSDKAAEEDVVETGAKVSVVAEAVDVVAPVRRDKLAEHSLRAVLWVLLFEVRL